MLCRLLVDIVGHFFVSYALYIFVHLCTWHNLVTSDDLQVSIYDLAEERCISMLSGHTNTINDLSINPQNETFATVSADKTLKFWDIRNKTYTSSVDSAHNDILWSCKHSINGEQLYTGSETGYFKVMSLN